MLIRTRASDERAVRPSQRSYCLRHSVETQHASLHLRRRTARHHVGMANSRHNCPAAATQLRRVHKDRSAAQRSCKLETWVKAQTATTQSHGQCCLTTHVICTEAEPWPGHSKMQHHCLLCICSLLGLADHAGSITGSHGFCAGLTLLRLCACRQVRHAGVAASE
jgi:hypothetical protein